jgi:phosphoserine phosphatase
MKISLQDALTLREELETLILLSVKNAHRVTDSIRLTPVAEVLIREAVVKCDEARRNGTD